jgi:hypothetical protein
MRVRYAVMTGVLLGLVTQPAAAQVCIGIPTVAGQRDAALEARFGDRSTTFGGSVGSNLQGPLAIRGLVEITTIDGSDDNLIAGGIQGAYEFVLPEVAFSPCATGGFTIGRRGDVTNVKVPIGVGIGTSVSAGPGMEFVPFAAPQIMWSRSGSVSNTDFALSAGAAFSGGVYYVRGAVSKVFRESSGAEVGISGGLKF